MDYKKHLLEKLKEAIEGKADYNQFKENFYNYYVTKVSDEALSDEDQDFFTEVQEKFEYTVIDPPEADRQYGYISYKEFVEWLKGKVKTLSK